jgi:dienelactone hydrolase
MKQLVHAVLLSCASLFLQSALAAAAPADGQSKPYYVQVPMKSALFTLHLTTLVYAPAGSGPWPVVVINHGKGPGSAHLQKDIAYPRQAKVFNAMGYAVVVPTRAGFGSSGGSFIQDCNSTGMGRRDADSIQAVIDWIRTQPQFDASTIVVQGQSTGGLAAVALAERNPPGVRAVLDFAGGFKNCSDYLGAARNAFKTYGEKARVPTLMLYGTNDAYWGDQGPSFFPGYHQGNPNSELYEVGAFKSDSHLLFGDKEGAKIWRPVVRKFFKKHGLPYKTVYRINDKNVIVDRETAHLTPDSYQVYKPAGAARQESED